MGRYLMSFNFNKYAFELGLMESNNNYHESNIIGALGKYQFIPTTLNGLKNLYSLPEWYPPSFFLNNPELQETYFKKHVEDLLAYVESSGIFKYFGIPVTGSKRFKSITAPLNIYGALAGMHLAGSGSIRRYFEEGKDPNDGLTSLTDYMAYFSNKISSSSSLDVLFAIGVSYLLYLLL